MTTLNQYEQQVQDLLHDQSSKWLLPQIDNYINEARRQLVMDTGCLRVLQATYVTAGVEQYSYGQITGGVILTPGSGYANPSVSFSGGGGSGVAASLAQSGGAVNTISFSAFGSGYSTAPTPVVTDTGAGTGATVGVGVINVNTFDILGVNMIWGTQRYSLQWREFTTFSTLFRQWTAQSYQRQPVCWSSYGDAGLFIGPTPDQTYPIEVDSIVLPTPLTDYVTLDPIPVMCQDPIKFYAAYLAKFNVQAYGEAESFRNTYLRRLAEVVSAYTRRIRDPYGA